MLATLPVVATGMTPLQALEITPSLNLQTRYFDGTSRWGTEQQYVSMAVDTEFRQTLSDDRQTLVFLPFARYDDQDEGRRYVDVREAYWSNNGDDSQWRVGVTRVNWGVMEVFKIVDVLNQKDANALPDREKLGQPMVSYTTYVGEDLVDVYLLQGLREIDFPEASGRFRYPLLVDEDNAEHEWGATGETDMAIRWKKQLGDWEFALSHFYGMNRNPYFVFNFDFNHPMLIPVYEKVNQASLDVAGEFHDVILKAEALFQTGDIERYGAVSLGAEYTFGAVLASSIDITALCEATYDSREHNFQMPYDRDVFAGARIAFNDAHDNALLLGAVVDMRYQQQMALAQWNANVGDHWKVRLAGSLFESAEPAPDRTLLDDAVFTAYDAIQNRRLPLDIDLVERLLSLAEERSLNPRDIQHFVEFLQRDDALNSLLDMPPQQVADTLYDVFSLSSPAQKMHWMEDDDFIQLDIFYYF